MVNENNITDLSTHAISIELNVAELQSVYLSAKEAQQIEFLKKLRERLLSLSDKLEQELPSEIHHARLVAMSIPELALKEAESGRRSVSVMKLSEDDFLKLPEYGEELGPHSLVPNRAPYFLYQLCLQKGLEPEIRIWHEENGFRSGFELCLNW